MYIREGLGYPFKDMGAIFVGGILSLFFFLLIPFLFVLGYMIRVMENTVRDIEEMPKWENWGDLLTKGVFYIIIGIAYLIIPIVTMFVMILVVGGGFSALGSVLKGSGGALEAIGTMLIVLILSLIIWLIFGVLSILALIRYAETGSIGSAFEFGFLYGKFKGNIVGYIGTGILLGILYSIIWSVVGVLCSLLIGFVLVPFVMFYLQLVGARTFSMIYRST